MKRDVNKIIWNRRKNSKIKKEKVSERERKKKNIELYASLFL